MSYPINYPTPQGANIQIFTGRKKETVGGTTNQWVKPQGASFVWFTLIGSGGNGNGTTGGGSGAVTNFMCPAFLIPDGLTIEVAGGNQGRTMVKYYQKNDSGYTLLTAEGSTDNVGGIVSNANAFTAMGFYQSVAGQDGAASSISASSTTFLSGGSGPTSGVTPNYGYPTTLYSSGRINGYFQMQPIIVGCGGSLAGVGGIGCGGGYNSGSGGNGMVVIITW
jgi:hypothetical protein